ncbi:FUSC family protein [Intrasporangium calvum]|uniref:Integral membrane bound transporter domain-containing protein n=1 Tax=Intrasporangium calvum (strain ATCC 23552 / DSM 43043 / JCM 3097 / NBRC 12989 / NCIMB 10167 / NRRL B-3866 / 7 KIP) TaxID=710696 RepID=E6SF93_INTC7|nr:FUSC family protein [Intrasporangium calvum]ADU49907.1 hypothetical protein Intca_3427 [Intrasporangium calvum DSM 43043]
MEPGPSPQPGLPGDRPLRQLGRSLVTMGPHRGAHRVALRAGISVLVPLLLLVSIGRPELTPYAAFGAFTSLYGRAHRHTDRTGMQAIAGVALVASVTLGVAVSLAPASQWLVVPVGALLAAWGSLTSDAYRWHPPGPLFLVFGFAVCAMVPAQPMDLLVAPAVAGASGVFSLLVGHVGALRDPASWARPVLPRPRFGDALEPTGSRAHLLRYLVAVTASGALATTSGWEHPYWAMVASVVVLSGPDLASRFVRGLQRIIGTLLGVGVAAAVLAWAPHEGAGAVLVIAGLQMLAELFVGRNYALALLFVTPLALLMGQLLAPSPVGPLLRDRLLETVLGALVAMVVLLTVPDRLPRPRRAPG